MDFNHNLVPICQIWFFSHFGLESHEVHFHIIVIKYGMGWCSMVTMKDEGQWLANLTVIVGGGTHGRTGIVIIIIVIFIAVLLEHYQSIQVFSLWQI